MTLKEKLIFGAIVVVVAIIGIGVWSNASVSLFGGIGPKLAENYDPYIRYNGGFNTALPFKTSSTMQIGSSGTAQSNQIVTTCNPIADTSIAATSTGYVFCTGVTGVTSADEVFAEFSTSTTAIGTNWVILGAHASTTAGAIDIKIMNLTGTAAVPSASAGAQFASSTRIFAAH